MATSDLNQYLAVKFISVITGAPTGHNNLYNRLSNLR
jgi:hypothetical protein